MFSSRRYFRPTRSLLLFMPLVLLHAAPALAEPPTVRQFVQMKWPVSADLAPDGTLYYVYNPDGLNQLYKVMPGKVRPFKLTDFPDGMAAYDLSPDGKWLAVQAAIGGNEQFDIYLIETQTARMRSVFAHPDIVYESVVWRRDSGAFAFRANDVSRSDFHVYLYDLATNSTKSVLAGSGDNRPVDFTADGKKVMVQKYNSASWSQLFEVTLETGAAREVTPSGQEWSYDPVGYTAGDKTFLAASNYKGDKSAFVAIDLAGGKIEHAFPALDAHEADIGVFNQDRSLLALGANEDGYRTIHLYSMPDKKEMKLPTIPKGLVGNLAFAGKDMLYAMENANTPGTIFRWSTDKPDAAPKAVTQPDTQLIAVGEFPLPELIRYKSFDGLEIPAFLYVPPGYKKGTPIPFVVSYHGGPEAQYRPVFDRLTQCLISRGYGVIAPNVRGSSGYGMKYLELDNYKKRMDSVKDGVAAAKWLIENKYSAAKKVAAYGGSYGGFMVNACVTEAPDVFGAACNVVGIVNFQTFLERTKDYRRKLREAEYGPLSDPEFLKSISPIYKVDRIACPMLIAHGDNDPRVPIHEARQLYDAIKKLNKPVEMLTFPDEGHGFRKENNRIVFYERLIEFFDKHLKGGEKKGT